ncbi:hypothetical protein O4H49_15625 [Kiloniella laminariae]|uniref:Lipoprotein n=1 Tax=Kiloniella laminariae TaxID=454162 RepID=A0ABT4LM69_9PROT|nr:hypothetical protein [Kiloniella laminariae]MCZ4282218.1 hypothetical protein [Kiloniella laminariae]
MKRTLSTLALSASLLVVSASFLGNAYAQELQNVVTTGETSLGSVLTDSKGMTLYTFANDSDGKSTCNGGCAQAWPPLLVQGETEETDEFTKITRDDGTQQWAYKGKALYGWVQDKNPGDVTGDNFKNVWHVAKP